jgi:hypothetical protein
MRVIVNTTVISNFASIGQLDVLRQLYGSLAMSTDVYDEIQAGVEEGYRFYAGIEQWVQPLAEGGWIHLTSASSSLDFGVESLQFHPGVFDAKLPVDAALFGIRFVRPDCDFSLQLGPLTDAAIA